MFAYVLIACLAALGLVLVGVVLYTLFWVTALGGGALYAAARGLGAGVRTWRATPKVDTGPYTGTTSAVDQVSALAVTFTGFCLMGLTLALFTPISLGHGLALGSLSWVLWLAGWKLRAMRRERRA